MTQVLKYIREHWRAIAEGLGLLGLILAYLQLELASKQFAFEQSRELQLEYSIQLSLPLTNQQVVSQVADQLVESYYDRLYRYAQAHPGTTYAKSVDAVLPLTATLPAQAVSASIYLRNNGLLTATRVRTVIDLDRPVTSLTIQSLEPYKILKGDLGERQFSIEFDRIVSKQAVTITIASEKVENQPQLDQLIMSISSELDLSKRFPSLSYVPARHPSIKVVTTSDQGPASLAESSETMPVTLEYLNKRFNFNLPPPSTLTPLPMFTPLPTPK